jgi:Radical SAM superfamily
MVPFHEVFVGFRCNLECQECSARASGVAGRSKSELVAAMSACTEPREGVVLSGGEPLLRSDIIELIQAARELGFPRIRLRSNGTALADPRLLHHLLSAGCHHFEIKLFAAEPRFHDRITGVSGSLEQTWAGLELLRRAVITGRTDQQPFVGILIPLRENNVRNLPETILALVALRPDRIVLSWEITADPPSRVLPAIRNAVNIALLNRTWILTENLPLCLMKDLEVHVAELYLPPRIPYEQVAQCRRCLYREFCPGIPARALKTRYRQEIKPVSTSIHLDALRSLVRRKGISREDGYKADAEAR